VLKQLGVDLRDMVHEQFEYRELMYQMTMRDLRLRYKQTVMGFGWAIFMPLVNTAIFSVIFMRVAPVEMPHGVPYPVFAYCGLLVWNFFSMSLKFAVNSLTSNANLVTKVYFPREIFPLSAVLVCLVDFVVAGAVLGVLMAWYGIPMHASLLFLPAVLAVHILFTSGIALLLAMSNLFFRDVKYLFEIVVTMWMFASSTVYPVDQIDGRLGLVMRLNPMTGIIESYRSVILYGTLPDPTWFAGTAAVALTVFLLSWLTFHRAEFRFAENI
jgi:ABC-2 type transport system permease protein/lipopolysaccharide transport system permease protein